MEMRLGKTLVTVRRCKLYRPQDEVLGLRVLVVAPNSALASWEKECTLESCGVMWLTGTRSKRSKALQCAFHPQNEPRKLFCLINKEGWIALSAITKMKWDAVVLDESTFIKNPKAKVTKFFLRNFRTTPHRWCLTGTPNPEGEENYFCQLAFLRDDLRVLSCANYWEFRQVFMQPGYGGFGWVMKPGASDVVRREVGRTCLVLRRKDVKLQEQKIFEVREFEFSGKVKTTYQKAEKDFVLQYDEVDKSTKWVTTQWQWLRQICGGFIEGSLIWDEKIKCVEDLINGELAGQNVVVWCCYNNEVRALSKRIQRARGLTGENSISERHNVVREFGKTYNVLVLQQAIAQMGMDLSVSDTAIYYSCPVGQMARKQTEDRILSVDKIKRGVPLLYIDLVVKNSVDEDVQKMIAAKVQRSDLSLTRALATAIKERITWTKSE